MMLERIMSDHHARPTLPPIHELIQVPLSHCRLSCGRGFSDFIERGHHEATCGRLSKQTVSQLQQPGNLQVSQFEFWADIDAESSSSSSTSGTYSDSGSSTLVPSRRPSIEKPGFATKSAKRSTPVVNMNRIRKNLNERSKRAQLAERTQGIEDIVGLYCGKDCYPVDSGQSRGNGRGAGLTQIKLVNFTIARVLLVGLLDDKYRKAIEEDKEDDFRTWITAIAKIPADNFTDQTFMEGGYDMSHHPHENDKKRCPVDCRKTRLEETFAENVSRFRERFACEIDTD